jgi:hypothetical protein
VPVRCEAVNSKAWARAMLKELDDHYSMTATIGFDNDAKNLATTNLKDSVFFTQIGSSGSAYPCLNVLPLETHEQLPRPCPVRPSIQIDTHRLCRCQDLVS